MSTGTEGTYAEAEENKLLNAEEVTLIATHFLKRLGHTQELKPIKASMEEDTYVVEVGLTKKTATVQIDPTTEQIKEYEIKENEEEPTAEPLLIPLTPKNIAQIAGVAAAAVVVSALLGISSLLPSIF
jgi:hypothetical protein